MKFLVILICLIVNYLWLKDFDRFNDGWFFRFRCQVEDWASNRVDNIPLGWLAAFILIYGLPLASLALILFICQRQFLWACHYDGAYIGDAGCFRSNAARSTCEGLS